MNKIYVDIDFTNGILEKKGIDLITGDYASTEIEFTFDESHSTGRKVFEMKSPSNELVIVKEIEDNKVLLAAKDENQNNVSLFNESGYYIFEVSYYDNDSKLTSVYGRIPVEQEQVVIDGEVVTPYLPIFDQLIQDLNNKIDEVDTKLEEVDTKLDNIDTALENVNTAIEETNNLDIDVSDKVNKDVTITLTKKDNTTKSVVISDGTSLQFVWQGTSLGIKTDDMQDYVFVNLQGVQGVPGPQGEPFRIKKTYPSVQAMNDDFNNMNYGDYVMIASSVEVQDNAKLYTRGEQEWIFITDFSGATGIKGETGATPNIQIGTVSSGATPSVTRTGTDENPILNFVLQKGDTGDTGETGPTGATGNGIASITKISSVDTTDTYRITFTDGTTYDYEITNGEVTQAQLDELQAQVDRYKLLENALPHIAGTGTELTLNNTANAPMTIDLEPNTSQETTTGKNLLKPTNRSTASNGITTTVNNDGSMTISGTTTNTWFIIGDSNVTVSIPQGNYVLSTKEALSFGLRLDVTYEDDTTYNSSTLTAGSTSRTITFAKAVKKLFIEVPTATSGTQINETLYLQLESGDTATDYEPYTGSIPAPNPEFPQQVHVVTGDNTLKVGNKNLIPTKEFTLHRTNKRTIQIDFEKPLTAGTYTISWKIASQSGLTSETPMGWALYNGSTNLGSLPGIYNGVTTSSSTKTTTKQITHLYAFISSNAPSDATITLENLQIEKGSTATTYEPHEEQTAQLNLPVKNFLNIDNSESGGINAQGELTTGNTTWRANSFIKVQPNTTYTFSRKQFNDNVQRAIRLYEYNSSQSFITPRAESYEKTLTITTSANTYYLKWSIFENQANFTKSIVETWNLQIELGTKANSYSPYGQEPIEYCEIPNSDYKDKFIRNSGKNLANPLLESGTINTSGQEASDSSSRRMVNYIYFGNATTIYFKRNESSVNLKARWYDENKTFVSTSPGIGTVASATLTPPSNARYLRLCIDNNNDNYFTQYGVMVSTENIDYEPYGTDTWYLKKNIPEYVFTGNEDIVNASTSNKYRIRINNAINYPPVSVSEVADILCNYYLPKSANDTYTNKQGIALSSTGYTIFIYDTAYDYENSAIDYKVYLQEKYNSGNPVKVKYVASTPKYILLNNTLQNALNTLESKLLAYKGQTNITQVNNDLPFEIVASALKDISNL